MTMKELRELTKDVPDDVSVGFVARGKPIPLISGGIMLKRILSGGVVSLEDVEGKDAEFVLVVAPCEE